MTDLDGAMGQTIVEADSGQTTRAIANGFGGRAMAKWPPLRGRDANAALNDQFYRTADRLLASTPGLGANHRA
jgi:hypothetical protein